MQEQIAAQVIDRAIRAGKDRRQSQSRTDHACYALLSAVEEMEDAAKTEQRVGAREALIATSDQMVCRLLRIQKQLERGQ